MDLLKWLVTEAGMAFLGIVIGVVGTWLYREKPPKVVVQEVEERQLLNIHISRSDRLKASYRSNTGTREDLHELRQRTFVIYNSGTKDILVPIDLYLSIQPSGLNFFLSFADLLIEPDTISHVISTSNNGYDVSVSLPCLNSLRHHDHIIRCHVISDISSTIFLNQTKSNGSGWSSLGLTMSKHKDINNKILTIIRNISLILFIIAFVCFSLDELGKRILVLNQQLTVFESKVWGIALTDIFLWFSVFGGAIRYFELKLMNLTGLIFYGIYPNSRFK